MFPRLYHQDVVIAKWDKWGLRYGGNAGLSKWTEGMLQRIIDEQPSARKWKWHQYDGMIAKLNKTKSMIFYLNYARNGSHLHSSDLAFKMSQVQ